MTIELEEFIKNYIKKDKRERLIYELDKRPEQAMKRFAHEFDDILDERYIIKTGKLTLEEALSEIKKRTKSKTAFVFTEECAQTQPLEDALQVCFDCYGGSILIADNVAFCKEEQEFGSPLKWILSK